MKSPISALPESAPRHDKLRHGLRIREISQKEVAAERGVSRNHLNYVLNGKRQSEDLLDFVEEYIREHDTEVTA